MTRRPRLSKEDQELWKRVAGSVTPLPRRRLGALEEMPGKQDPSRNAGNDQAGPGKAAKAAKPERAPARQPAPAAPGTSAKKQATPLDPRRLIDIDRRNAERLRRGQMPIEGVLDLHGHRQHEAEEALGRFLAAAQAADKRCILVITGKGQIGESRGVLRQKLGQWLNETHNRGRVLAFAQAQPKHGGAGAFYVLLKRRRT